MRRRGSSVFAWCIAALLSLSAGAGRAQAPTDQAAAAEALFREGRDLAAKGNYADACPKFAASQKLDPGYGTLWNLADCLERTGRTASAWAAFREAADLAKKAGQADREKKATRRAGEIEPKLTRMTISIKDPPPGLEVKRDGVLVDAAAFGTALPVDPGKHTVEASAPGKKPFSTEVETAGPGKTAAVEVPPLADAPAEAAGPAAAPGAAPRPGGAPDSPEEEDGGAGTRRTLAFVAGGVGLAGVVVGSIFGASASSKWSEAQDEHCRTATLCDARGVELAGDAKTFATVSTVGFIVGGVGIGAGVALFVSSLGGDPAGAGLRITPAVGSQGGGVEVGGRF